MRSIGDPADYRMQVRGSIGERERHRRRNDGRRRISFQPCVRARRPSVRPAPNVPSARSLRESAVLIVLFTRRNCLRKAVQRTFGAPPGKLENAWVESAQRNDMTSFHPCTGLAFKLWSRDNGYGFDREFHASAC